MKGSIWQSGYYESHLRDRKAFDERLKYMHENPVRKGLVKVASEYPFSTAHRDYQHEVDWGWLEGAAE
jgi:putative transposase